MNSLCEGALQMYRALLVVIGVLAPIHFANANCDITKADLPSLKEAESNFRASPSAGNAELFLDQIPNRFCKFNLIFGWIDDAPTPLYEVPLHLSLTELAQFIPAATLVKKYVALASQAAWEADNVNALQSAYYELFLEHPEIVINEILALQSEEADTAVRFLFDGPHPNSSFLDASEKRKICQLSAKFCALLNAAERKLTDETHAH